ncbi:MAG: HAMP domain-containing histidine kinase [Bifidobacteriaceae bacterium]|nr:HAMP domain-containing histidine kinase [Bifidobacteriaceae bacterium]
MKRFANGWPLRLRLAAIIAALLIAGLTAAGLANVLALRQAMMVQVDTQLATAMQSLQTIDAAVRNPGPTDYVVMLFAPDGQVDRIGPPARRMSNGGPALESLTVSQATAAAATPFTVSSTDGPGRWRMRAALIEGPFGLTPVALGVSLDGLDKTVDSMWITLLRTAVVVVGVGTVAGFFLVRRSLRPLRQVEATAATIAAGDLTKRVPPAPAGTEVGTLTASLNSMLTQIEEAFAARTASERRMRQFVADASHELRTPLAAIRGYGELYRIGALEDSQELAGAMRRIEDESARMGHLVADLLQLTRLDEGRPLRREPVDLTILAADAAADLKALDPSRPILLIPDDDAPHLSSAASGDPATKGTLASGGGAASSKARAVVMGDPLRIRQVLANLVGNVARHTPPGTPAELSVWVDSPQAGRPWAAGVVEVRDHGPGIPSDLTSKVFERFYRLDASRSRDSGGSGLGLAIVASIVEAQAGRVTVRTTDAAGGATFRVELPLAGAEAMLGLESGAEPAGEPGREGSPGSGVGGLDAEHGGSVQPGA